MLGVEYLGRGCAARPGATACPCTREATNALLAELGYREDQLAGENTTKVYARYGIDLASIAELRFDEPIS